MKRFLFVLALLLALSSSAATISSSTCPGTGCSLSYVPDTPAVAVSATGTWSGTLTVELSADALTFRIARAYPVGGGTYTSTLTTNGSWLVPTEGLVYLRVRASAWTSGTATVTLRHSSALPAVDVVRVVGSTFGEVAVSGTVNAALTTESIAALGPQACAHAGVRRLALGATPEPVPNNLPDGGSGAMPERTMITLQNVDGTRDVACRFDPGDGGVPDCAVPGYGLTIFPRARYVELPARDSDKLLCVACTGNNVPLEYLERSCSR